MSNQVNQFASAVGLGEQATQATQEACQQIADSLDGSKPSLLIAFISYQHCEQAENVLSVIHAELQPEHVLGCCGETVIHGEHEYEQRAAISLWAAVWPTATIHPFHLEFGRVADGIVCSGFPQLEAPRENQQRFAMLFPEPFSSSLEHALHQVSPEKRSIPVIGGVASGGRAPRDNRLFLDQKTYDYGCVGMVIDGAPALHTVVSQGCRPIGQPFIVTKAKDNVIEELGGKPVMEQLGEVLENCSPRERDLIAHGLHLGIVMNEYQDHFERGDFLVGNVLGINEQETAILVSHRIRVGQTVQFHVRDAVTATEDLRELIEQDHRRAEGREIGGGLLVTCNGRGMRLFDEPHHDVSLIREVYGELPLIGFFAQGELGPVGGKNFVHGFTASLALFEK